MFTLAQVLIPVALLASVVLSLPLTENDGQIDSPTGEYGFPEDFNNADDDRIHGGEQARPAQFRHQVSLRLRSSGTAYTHICGGAILNSRYIITAAHCYSTQFPQPERYRIVTGALLNNGNDGVNYNVRRWTRHEGFLANFTQPNPRVLNDIAVVQTTTPINFNRLTGPIALHRGTIGGGANVVTSGWGTTNDNIRGLKFVNMFTLTNANCRARFLADGNRPAPVHDWHTICAFSGKEGHGVCNGDSGGALVFESRIIGITSWGRGFLGRCALGVPDGFMRISNFLPWIDRAITQFP